LNKKKLSEEGETVKKVTCRIKHRLSLPGAYLGKIGDGV
jgi:hypothetical protein